MLKYFVKRLFLIFPTLLGISIACFIIIQILPGGPIEEAIQKISNIGKGGSLSTTRVNEREIERLKKIYGFDKHPVEQYFIWLFKIIRGDFGESFRTYKPVLLEIGERIPTSLMFGLSGFLLSYLICIPLGIKKSLKHNTIFDTTTSIIVYIGYSIPGFALGVLLLVLLGGGTFLNLFPLSGVFSDNFEYLKWYEKIFDVIHHMILPVICYSVGGFAVLTVVMKNSLMEELNKDYIKTAMAKGLSYKQAVFKHALKNALIPIATGIGGLFSIFFAGSILIERVFSIPGMGLLGYEAMLQRNYPVVMGIIIIQSLFNLLGRIVSDIALVIVDPRITFE